MAINVQGLFEETLCISELVTSGLSAFHESAHLAARSRMSDALERMKVLRVQLEDDALFFRCAAGYGWTSGFLAVMLDRYFEICELFPEGGAVLMAHIACCQEFIQMFPLEPDNMKSACMALGDMHLAVGDFETCEEQYKTLLSLYPAWGGGYRAWANVYYTLPDGLPKAAEILKRGLEQPELELGNEDRAQILSELTALCRQTGDAEGARSFNRQYRELQPTLSPSSRHYRQLPVQSQKIGRNSLCPCGSGKKYKHCCGA